MCIRDSREDDETFKNAVDYMFDGLERRSPQHLSLIHIYQGSRTSGQIDPKDAGKRSNEIVAERNKMAVKQVPVSYTHLILQV